MNFFPLKSTINSTIKKLEKFNKKIKIKLE